MPQTAAPFDLRRQGSVRRRSGGLTFRWSMDRAEPILRPRQPATSLWVRATGIPRLCDHRTPPPTPFPAGGQAAPSPSNAASSKRSRSRSPCAADLKMRSARVVFSVLACCSGPRRAQASSRTSFKTMIVSGSNGTGALPTITDHPPLDLCARSGTSGKMLPYRASASSDRRRADAMDQPNLKAAKPTTCRTRPGRPSMRYLPEGYVSWGE
jgi:hypothetical protein